MSCTSIEYQGASGFFSFVAGRLGYQFGGSFGQAYGAFLLGQNNIVAQFSALFEKVEANTDTRITYRSDHQWLLLRQLLVI